MGLSPSLGLVSLRGLAVKLYLSSSDAPDRGMPYTTLINTGMSVASLKFAALRKGKVQASK